MAGCSYVYKGAGGVHRKGKFVTLKSFHLARYFKVSAEEYFPVMILIRIPQNENKKIILTQFLPIIVNTIIFT